MNPERRFEVRSARRGVLRRRQWYAVFVAGNGREVWRTSETYNNPADVAAAIRTVDGLGRFLVVGP